MAAHFLLSGLAVVPCASRQPWGTQLQGVGSTQQQPAHHQRGRCLTECRVCQGNGSLVPEEGEVVTLMVPMVCTQGWEVESITAMYDRHVALRCYSIAGTARTCSATYCVYVGLTWS
jgi:hypothetical protein